MNILWIVLISVSFIVIGYLLGSVLWSEILAIMFGKNIREIGSKNPGATNLSRAIDKKTGFVAALLDATKGYIAVIIAWVIYTYTVDRWSNHNPNLYGLIYFAGTFAVIGHCYPILYVIALFKNRFNFEQAKSKSGGKGVSTSGGVLFTISPWLGLLAFGIWLVIILTTRYVAVASIICMVITPFFIFISQMALIYLFTNNTLYANSNRSIKEIVNWTAFIAMYINALLIMYRHKTNLIRLKNKQESKFF